MAKNCRINLSKDHINIVNSNGFVATHEPVQKASHKPVWYLDSGTTPHIKYGSIIF